MNPYVQVVLENLLPVLSTVLAVVLPILATYALKVWSKKVGFEIDNEQLVKLEGVIDQAVMYAEEQGRKKLAEGTEARPSGAQKMDKAMEFAQAEMKRQKIDELGAEHLKKMLEAALARKR